MLLRGIEPREERGRRVKEKRDSTYWYVFPRNKGKKPKHYGILPSLLYYSLTALLFVGAFHWRIYTPFPSPLCFFFPPHSLFAAVSAVVVSFLIASL